MFFELFYKGSYESENIILSINVDSILDACNYSSPRVYRTPQSEDLNRFRESYTKSPQVFLCKIMKTSDLTPSPENKKKDPSPQTRLLGILSRKFLISDWTLDINYALDACIDIDEALEFSQKITQVF